MLVPRSGWKTIRKKETPIIIIEIKVCLRLIGSDLSYRYAARYIGNAIFIIVYLECNKLALTSRNYKVFAQIVIRKKTFDI